jgi:hypothetical protein
LPELVREELCSRGTDDLDPAHRTLRVRAETIKNRREQVAVPGGYRGPAVGLPAAPDGGQPSETRLRPLGWELGQWPVAGVIAATATGRAASTAPPARHGQAPP